MRLLASVVLLHGSGPLDLLMVGGPTLGIVALIGGAVVAPFFRGPAKMGFGAAYGLAVGALLIAGIPMMLAASLLDLGYFTDRWSEWRLFIAMFGAASTLVTLGALSPAAARILRALALVCGVLTVAFIALVLVVT